MKRNGFTLVELLVVIAIISILTVITVSQFQTARQKANDAQRKGDVNAVTKALQMYFADYNTLPPANDLNDLFISGVGFTDATGYIYMKVMPKETKTGWPPYCYEVDSTFKKYVVFARLENTSDSDCHMNAGNPLYQDRCGTSDDYCFAVTSPNAALNAGGVLE